MFITNYFGLKRGKVYRCSLDDPGFKGKFEYKLHKHYLVYRKIGGEWDYHRGKTSTSWQGVWNPKWYDETKACYQEVVWTKSKR